MYIVSLRATNTTMTVVRITSLPKQKPSVTPLVLFEMLIFVKYSHRHFKKVDVV